MVRDFEFLTSCSEKIINLMNCNPLSCGTSKPVLRLKSKISILLFRIFLYNLFIYLFHDIRQYNMQNRRENFDDQLLNKSGSITASGSCVSLFWRAFNDLQISHAEASPVKK